MLHMKTLAEIQLVIVVIKCFVLTRTLENFRYWIKRMDSKIFLSVQNFNNIYTRENDKVPFILTSYEISIFYQDETSY